MNPPRPPLDYVLEVVAVLLLLGMLAGALLSFGHLPERIPTHFNAAGVADGFGSRWLILVLPGIGLLLWGLLTFLNRFPHLWNYPVKITLANAASQYRRGRTFMTLLKVEILAIFAYLVGGTVLAATTKSNQLQPLILWSTMGLLLLTIVVYVVRTVQDRDIESR